MPHSTYFELWWHCAEQKRNPVRQPKSLCSKKLKIEIGEKKGKEATFDEAMADITKTIEKTGNLILNSLFSRTSGKKVEGAQHNFRKRINVVSYQSFANQVDCFFITRIIVQQFLTSQVTSTEKQTA